MGLLEVKAFGRQFHLYLSLDVVLGIYLGVHSFVNVVHSKNVEREQFTVIRLLIRPS